VKKAFAIAPVCIIAFVLLIYVIGMIQDMGSPKWWERRVRDEAYLIAQAVFYFMNYYGEEETMLDMPETTSEWYEVLCGDQNPLRIRFLEPYSRWQKMNSFIDPWEREYTISVDLNRFAVTITSSGKSLSMNKDDIIVRYQAKQVGGKWEIRQVDGVVISL
jgi:hypothetical protein